MTDMPSPVRDATGMLLAQLDRMRAADREALERRDAEDRKEKKRTRRLNYFKWSIPLGFLIMLIFNSTFAWKRADKLLDMLPSAPQATFVNTAWKGEATILVLPIQGAIGGHPLTRSESKGILSMFSDTSNTVLSVQNALREASAMKGLAEVIMFVESPGGAVSPADEIFSMIKAWRAQHPAISVAAYFYSMAASGGYYVAMAADTHVAGPTAMVGSLSVVMQMPNVAELAKTLGVTMNVIKTGKIKDIGNMFREMTDAERAVLQRVADQIHERFVEVINTGRPRLTREQIAEIADGRIFSAKDALEVGLIDAISPTFEDFLAQRVKGVMERNKAGKVYVMYPGSASRASEIVVQPNQ